MAEEVEDKFPGDDPVPEFFVSANVLFAAYVQQERFTREVVREMNTTCNAYLLLMDEIKALSERVNALATGLVEVNNAAHKD